MSISSGKRNVKKTVLLSPNDVKDVTIQDIPALEKMMDEKVTYDLFGNVNLTDLLYVYNGR